MNNILRLENTDIQLRNENFRRGLRFSFLNEHNIGKYFKILYINNDVIDSNSVKYTGEHFINYKNKNMYMHIFTQGFGENQIKYGISNAYIAECEKNEFVSYAIRAFDERVVIPETPTITPKRKTYFGQSNLSRLKRDLCKVK